MVEGVGKNLPRFFHTIGRAETGAAFFRFCREFLDQGRPMPLEPALEKLSMQDRRRACLHLSLRQSSVGTDTRPKWPGYFSEAMSMTKR